MIARNAAGLGPDDPPFLPDSSTRATLRDRFGPTIDEGIRVLGSAIKIDPNYSDAMAYMNLLYRLKAFIAENTADSTANLKEAEQWVKKSLAANPKDHRKLSPLAAPPASASSAAARIPLTGEGLRSGVSELLDRGTCWIGAGETKICEKGLREGRKLKNPRRHVRTTLRRAASSASKMSTGFWSPGSARP